MKEVGCFSQVTGVESSTITECHTVMPRAKVIDGGSPAVRLTRLNDAALGTASIHLVPLGLLDGAVFVFGGAAQLFVVHRVALVVGELGLSSNLLLVLNGSPGQVIQMNIEI